MKIKNLKNLINLLQEEEKFFKKLKSKLILNNKIKYFNNILKYFIFNSNYFSIFRINFIYKFINKKIFTKITLFSIVRIIKFFLKILIKKPKLIFQFFLTLIFLLNFLKFRNWWNFKLSKNFKFLK